MARREAKDLQGDSFFCSSSFHCHGLLSLLLLLLLCCLVCFDDVVVVVVDGGGAV